MFENDFPTEGAAEAILERRDWDPFEIRGRWFSKVAWCTQRESGPICGFGNCTPPSFSSRILAGWKRNNCLLLFLLFCALLIYKSINKTGRCTQRISQGHLGFLLSFSSLEDLICGISLPPESRSTEDITVYSIHDSFHCFVSCSYSTQSRTSRMKKIESFPITIQLLMLIHW